jgi:Ca2+:H+ antiporter
MHNFLSQSWVIALMSVLLIASVFMAVHHAEVIAHKVGEPFGTLILAVCVTVIEVALIVSMMLSGGVGAELIARDAVFAAIMIVMNGVIGLCIFMGGLRHKELSYRIEGTNPALAVLLALATFTLVLPIFTTSSAGPTYTSSQLIFIGLISLLLYGTFIFIQTVRHRDYFLPVLETQKNDANVHASPPDTAQAWVSASLLAISLVLVVGLAKALSPTIESALQSLGAPKAVVGIAIAALVLLPESIAALRSALSNRLQTSLNLALGSALASIGLTIPAVALVSVWFHIPISLGVNSVGLVLLVLTMLVGILTLATGRATLLQGVVHLLIFFAYLFLTLVP